MKVSVVRPPSYDEGAYKVEVHLSIEEEKCQKKHPVPFRLPKLAKRSIIPDSGYFDSPCEKAELYRGGFKRGVWKGHIYSNGVDEKKNPTPIGSVKAAIEKSVSESISISRAMG